MIYDTQNIPDPKMHQSVSFIKSLVRIVAGVALIGGSFMIAGGFLILAELLGILEELV